MNKFKKIISNLLKMLILPFAVYLIFWILCQVRGVSGFGAGTDRIIILRNTCYTGLIALAVSYNLTSGRFDFSVGSTLILSTTIGGFIALQFGLGPVPMLVLSIVAGAILGSINGGVYCVLKLPPMVVSLGMTMIFEAIAFKISGGNGISLLSNKSLMIWSKQPYIYIMVFIITAILYIILNKTKFGYNTRSLQSGQEISVNIGINEKKNAIGCYVIAGGCLASAGVINMSVLGNVVPELSLASTSYIANAFLPMFIGNLLAKYLDRNVGVLIGALTQSIIFAGIGKLGIPTAWQAAINGFITIGFFAYSYNAYKIIEFQMFREKRAKALEAKSIGTITAQ